MSIELANELERLANAATAGVLRMCPDTGAIRGKPCAVATTAKAATENHALRIEVYSLNRFADADFFVFLHNNAPAIVAALRNPQAIAKEVAAVAARFANDAAAIEQQLAEARAERDALREDLEVADKIGGTFWEALKPLKLQAINVHNPGRHITDLIAERDALRAEVERLKRQIPPGPFNPPKPSHPKEFA